MASNKFKTLCKEEAYKNRLGKVITPNETITNTDNLSSIEITDSCISNNKIVGTAIAKTIKFTTTEDYELVDKEIDAQIGVLYDDTTTEYINVGKYTINKENANNTSKKGEYNGLDLLKKLDTTYVCGITDLSKATIGDFWKDACNQVGLTPNETTFTNSNIVIGGNPFNNNETVKTVMQQVAEAGMYWVEIDNDTNKVKLNWFTNTIEETFTKDDYSYLEKNNTYGPINSLVVGLKDVEGENVARQDSASVTKVGENQFAIYDNYFLYNEELRNQAIDNLWNKIKGFTYVNYSLTTYTGKPYLKRGSKISIEENDGTTFETYVLNHTFTYDGAFKSVISANSITNGETTNKNLPESASSKFKKVELKVDKVEGEIAAVVEQVKDIEVETTLTKEANGNPVVVTDAGPYKLESIKIEGKSYQETRSGANLLGGIDGVSGATDNKDGTYSQAITELTTIHWFITEHTITIPSGKDFYLSFDAKASSNQTKGINTIYCNDGTSNINGTAVTSPNLSTNYQRYVFKVNALDIEKTLTRISTQQSTLDGATITYKNLMVSFNNVAYEQYGASPSPDFPSEIKNVEGVTNYFDYSLGENGFINDSGEIASREVQFASDYIPCNSGEDWVIGVNDSFANIGVAYFDKDKNIILPRYDNANKKEIAITIPENVKYFRTWFYKHTTIPLDANVLKNTYQAQIQKEKNITSYVPFGRWLEQKTIGKNKLYLENVSGTKNGITYTWEGTKLTLSGTATEWTDIYNFGSWSSTIQNRNRFLKAGTYTLSVTGPSRLNRLNTNLFSNGNLVISASHTLDYSTRTLIEDMYYCNCYVSIHKGVTFNNETFKFQLEEGSTATPYEPYKETTALIDMNKKNHINIDDLLNASSEIYNGSTFSNMLNLTLEPNTQYVLFSNVTGTSTGPATDRCLYKCENNETIAIFKDKEYKFTTDNTGEVKIGFINNRTYSSEITNKIAFIKLYEGIETDDYFKLASIGDIKDTFENGVLTQRIGKVVLDGSENWHYTSSNKRFVIDQFGNGIFIPTDTTRHIEYIKSNYFFNSIEDIDGGMFQYQNQLIFHNNTLTTLEEFKTWLSENQVEVYYTLETPIEHTLNYELLELHKGYNNITTNDELEPNMEIRYLTDSKLNAKYATKGELKIESDSIKQSVSGEISALDQKTEASLELKVDTVDYNDKKIISMINASADEINLKANRFSLESTNATITKEGVVDFVKGTIGNIEIGDNYLRIPITVKVEITQELIDEVLDRYMNDDTFTAEEIEMYDLNKDGEVGIGDIAFMRNAMQYNITPNNPGYLEILSDEFKSHIAVIDGNGKEQTKVSLTGITSNSISGDRISANDLMVSGQDILSRLETNAMTLAFASHTNIELTQTYTYSTLRFDTIESSYGSKLTYKNGEIVIGAGVKKVRVNANVMNTGPIGTHIFSISKNNVMMATIYPYHYNATAYDSASITSKILEVNEGDTIQLKIGANVTGTFKVGAKPYTWLTVEVVE
jgi:hypothetical protein